MDVEELNKIGVHAVFTPGTRKDALLQRLAAIL
jgi:methylmalonyl-CoA mutase cobalamin-binding subunit